jgi:hypothetical protein
MAASFLKRIHLEDEEDNESLQLLGKDLLKYLTETLELDLNSLHIAFKRVFDLPIILVMMFRKTLRRSEGEYVKQKHLTRHYEFEHRLTRLKIVPRNMRVVFYVVKRSRSRSHPWEAYERMATIRIEDTYLRFLNSGHARDKITTISPSYVVEGHTTLPSHAVEDAFRNRTNYQHQHVKPNRPACYELSTYGKCSRLDRGLTCKFAHPKYMADRDVIRPLICVKKESGEIEYQERVKRRCARCTLPLERGGAVNTTTTTTDQEDEEEKEENLKRNEICERCRTCTLPSRAFSMPRSYKSRPVARFREVCLKHGIRTGVLNLHTTTTTSTRKKKGTSNINR